MNVFSCISTSSTLSPSDSSASNADPPTEAKKKCLKFQHLPLIIQKRIIERMRMKTVFDLSLTSKTMCAHIQALKATPVESVTIRYQATHLLRIYFYRKCFGYSSWIVNVPQNPLKTSIQYRLDEIRGKEENLGNRRIPIQRYPSRWFPRAGKEDLVLRSSKSTNYRLEFQLLSNNWNSVVQLFHLKFQGHCDLTEIDSQFMKRDFVPPPIPVTDKLHITGDTVRWSAVKKLLKTIKVLVEVTIFGVVEGNVKDLHLFKTDALYTKRWTWFQLEQIVTLNCRIFKGIIGIDQTPMFGMDDIVRFIQVWKNSNNTTLEYIEMKWRVVDMMPIEFTPNEVRKLDAKRWDPEVRDEDFCLVKCLKTMEKYVVPCGSSYDVQRSDGLIATCRFTPEKFQLVVWHKRFAS